MWATCQITEAGETVVLEFSAEKREREEERLAEKDTDFKNLPF